MLDTGRHPRRPARIEAVAHRSGRVDPMLGPGRLVDRPRLVARLQEAAEGPLTILAAPAGYGKSVVLAQWEAQRPGPVAHVALRPTDGAAGIAARLVAALGELGAPVDPAGAATVGDGPHLGEACVTAMAEGIEAVDGGVLVVDGLDAPTDGRLVEDLRSLLRRAPDDLHVVVAQRSRWPASPGLDGFRPAVVLGADDLAFTPEDARRLLRDVAGSDVPDSRLEAVLERTEGWAVALRLVAIALRGSARPGARIEDLAGDDRYLAGYVRDEVLAALPTPMRRFLSRTSVLDRLSAPLCDAVTGHRDGAEMLSLLEERGVFTHRVEGEAGWFRYHPTFRAVVRLELRRGEPDAEAGLLVRAAGWHLGCGEPGRAFRYLVEAGDEAGLIDLVDRWGRLMFERGQADEVLRWLESVPGCRDPRRAGLAMRRAYLATMSGNTRLAYQVVHDLDVTGLTAGEAIAVDALRATWAFVDGSSVSVIHAADAALSAVDDVDPGELPDVFGLTSPPSLRLMAAGSRARAVWSLGEIGAGRRALTELAQREDAYPPWRARVLGTLAMLEAFAGNLRVAERHAGRALDLSAVAGLLHHPACIDARLALAHVACERGEQHRARALLAEAEAEAARIRQPITLALLGVERAVWLLADGHPERGLVELERDLASGDPPPPPLVEGRRRAAEARLRLALGEVERARAVLDRPSPGGIPLPGLAAVSVQVAVAGNDVARAVALLADWHPDAAEPRALLERELWAAILDDEAGERRRARRRTAGLVAEARAERHVGVFLDVGRPAERLLRNLRHGSSAPNPYLDRLVEATEPPARAARRRGAAGLSDRELEVVRYLPTSLSNGEIAAQLYISLNTVKTHLRAIYRKLEVTGRREAIRRAEELGIA